MCLLSEVSLASISVSARRDVQSLVTLKFVLYLFFGWNLSHFFFPRKPSSRVVERLKGHSAVIRDIHHDPSRNVLLTASYDKTVKVWGH